MPARHRATGCQSTDPVLGDPGHPSTRLLVRLICAVCQGRSADERRREMCGRPVGTNNRQIRFRLPEPVLESPGQERVPGACLSHENPEASVMMQIPGVGPFVRALLVVRLNGRYAVTYGLWVRGSSR